MYLKRTSKLLDLSVPQITADVHLRDLTCPICRGILIEPVTLPCTHNLCLGCLKGTFEHNSLNCPLCRVRVGSWLRTATKSETLVNNNLWDLIRAKFPKEVESKHHGEEGDLDLDADYAPNRILSAAGEIHREYEIQLKMAEEEMRRRRQAEQMASEALIQKIQKAEQQMLLAQLAEDELLAKSLAKQQVVENQKVATKCYNECLSAPMSSCVFDTSRFNAKNTFVNNVKALQTETVHLENRQMNPFEDVRDGLKRHTNVERLSKIETIYSNVYNSNEINASSAHKSRVKYCCQKQMPVYNAVAKTLKHQTVSKFVQPCTSSYMDPGCSTSRAYTTETKEELHVPNDVVNNKKKSLGIEICTTLADNDERIGSAESSGSHDSINQEIHHFKPIKAVPRTKLKISTDGKLIDPKLIRVIPILKKAVSNVVPKPPSPTCMKPCIGCSWSAFRGRIKQDVKKKQTAHDPEDTKKAEKINQNSSTSPLDYSLSVANKSITKPLQMNDAIRRLDFMPELSPFDNNKNYTKNVSKIVNDAKMSKKISADNESDARKAQKSWRKRAKGNMVTKYKRYKNLRNIKKGIELVLTATDEEEDNSTDLNFSIGETSLQNDEQNSNDNTTVDNRMERIKRKRENREEETSISETESHVPKRCKTTRNKLSETRNKSPVANQILLPSSQESTELDGTCTSHAHKTKRRKMSRTAHSNTNGSEKAELSKDANNKITVSSLRKSARNLTKISSKVDNHESTSTRNNKSNSKLNRDSLSTPCDEAEECVQENTCSHVDHGKLLSDKEVIEEQQRIERVLLQERKDLEFARRLQAQFDEMEWISGRTRRSRKATENVRNEVESREIDSAMRIVYGTSKTQETAKREPVANRIVSTTAKRKLGRPPKCVKVTLQTCKNESGAR